MILFYNGKRFVEYEFEKEADFEKEISKNSNWYLKIFSKKRGT